MYPSNCSTYCTYQRERDNTPPSTVLFFFFSLSYRYCHIPARQFAIPLLIPHHRHFLISLRQLTFFFFCTYSTGKRIRMPPPATFPQSHIPQELHRFLLFHTRDESCMQEISTPAVTAPG